MEEKKKIVISVMSLILTAAVTVFIVFASMSDCGNLPFRFVGWSDIGGLFGYKVLADKSPLTIQFLNIGNADSIIIKSPEANILIDSGESESADDVVRAIRKSKIYDIDYFIATNPNSDNIGGCVEVFKNFSIGEFISTTMPDKIKPVSADYDNMVEGIEKYNIKYVESSTDKKIKCGDLTIEFLAPVSEYSEINDQSIVLKLSYKGFEAIFMSDAGKTVEKDLMDKYGADKLKADVIKIGDHGSYSASSESFIKSVGASYCIVSCRKTSGSLTPSSSTMDILKDSGGYIYRTDINGNITVLTDGTSIEVQTDE